eukprot:PhM_4_TR5392/c0_g1_i4/m.84201/K01754/E4.3.1.19, ilvA, tdcB; threonine dehydratase
MTHIPHQVQDAIRPQTTLAIPNMTTTRAGSQVPTETLPVQFVDISVADHRLRSRLRRTPLQQAHLGTALGIDLYYKLENMHWTGSFKERGALNALMNLSEEQRKTGVIAASAGNHALALAYHGKELGIPVTVVMPRVAPLTKVSQCRNYGADVHIVGAHIGEAREYALTLQEKNNMTYINGFDDPHIIAGAGTLGLEILAEMPDVDVIVVPVGGAGMLAGVSLAVKSLKPDTEIIAVESVNCASYTEALLHGKPTAPIVKGSLADGLAVPVVGGNAFKIASQFVREDDVVLVSERDIAHAIVRMMETEKIVAEGGGIVGLAAILGGVLTERLRGKKVVTCICGGNIDITVLGRVIERGLYADGRMLQFDAAISDSPGGVARFSSLIAEKGASIKEIMQEHPFITDVSVCSVHVTVEVHGEAHGRELIEHLNKNGIMTQVITDEKWGELNNHFLLSGGRRRTPSSRAVSPSREPVKRGREGDCDTPRK